MGNMQSGSGILIQAEVCNIETNSENIRPRSYALNSNASTQLSFPFQTIDRNLGLIQRLKGLVNSHKSTSGVIIVGEQSSGKTAILERMKEEIGHYIVVKAQANATKEALQKINDINKQIQNYQRAEEGQIKPIIIMDDLDKIVENPAIGQEELFLVKELLDKLKELKIFIIASASKLIIKSNLPDLNSRIKTMHTEFIA